MNRLYGVVAVLGGQVGERGRMANRGVQGGHDRQEEEANEERRQRWLNANRLEQGTGESDPEWQAAIGDKVGNAVHPPLQWVRNERELITELHGVVQAHKGRQSGPGVCTRTTH
jgi:hypothetical protein